VGLFNPMGVLRDVQMAGPEAAISNQPLFACLTCNRCMMYCPTSKENEGMNFAALIQRLRSYAYHNQIQPKDFGEFPGIGTILIHPSDFTSKDLSIKEIPDVDVISMLDNSLKSKIATEGKIAYFIDDLPLYIQKYPQYKADLIEIPRSVIHILNQVGIKPVVLNLKPLGHDDFWAGFTDQFQMLAKANVAYYKAAGVKQIIVESAEAYRTWKYDYPTVVSDCDFEVYHLSEYLEKFHLSPKLVFDANISISVTFLDAARLGRMGGRIYEPPRKILKKAKGIKLKDLEFNRGDAYDCSLTIHFPENEETQRMRSQLLDEIREASVEYVVSTSPKQIIHYLYAVNNLGSEGNSMPIIHDWAVMLFRLLRIH